MPGNVHSHLDNFPVTGYLTGSPTTGENLDFSKILIIDTLANSSQSGMTSTAVGTNSSKLTTIADSDSISGHAGLGADTEILLAALFAPERHPAEVYLLSVDLVGTDTIESAVLALEAVLPDYYAVLPVSRTQSVIADCVDAILQAGISGRHIVIAGISSTADATAANATWVAGTLGAQSASEKQRCMVFYHNGNGSTAADYAEYAARLLTVDLDRLCPTGNQILTDTPELAKLASTTAKNNLDDNYINHALPMSRAVRTYVDGGWMLDGTPVYEILTRDWLEDRLQTAAAGVKLAYTARDEKLPMTPTGKEVVAKALQGVITKGIAASHLLSPDEAEALGKAAPFVRVEAIDADDIAARQMRVTIRQYTVTDARQIPITFFLSA